MTWRLLRQLFRLMPPLADGEVRFPGEVPFHSQRLHAENRDTEGFPDATDAAYWSKRGCGIACIKMAIAALKHADVSLRQLLNEGLVLDAYREDVGWIHRGLADLATYHSMRATCRSVGKDLSVIARHIAEGGLVIASVAVGFEVAPKNAPGGHLVLIHGATVKDGVVTELLVHHPSSDAAYEAPSMRIDTNRFLTAFSRRGNVILLS